MTRHGFVTFIAATAVLLAFPLFAVLGSPVLWVLLAFLALAFWGVWYAILRNQTDRLIEEHLVVEENRVHLAHRPARGETLEWTANPHWVRVEIHSKGPVENYLTLSGGPRKVEIGRFLTPEERESLYEELTRAFDDVR